MKKAWFINIAIWASFSLTGAFLVLLPNYAFARNYNPHTGYLASTDTERDEQLRDLVAMQKPSDDGISLKEKIFNDQLSREFKERYETKFGHTDAERVYYSPNKFSYFADLYGNQSSFKETDDEKRKFGEYMVRRLTEWHLDNYAKNDPKVRPVWEAKERLSQVNVQVSMVKINAKYAIAGNFMDINFENPWVESKLTFLGNPGHVGGHVDETLFSIGKPLTKTIRLDSHYYFTDGIVSLVGSKSLTANLGTSLTASTFTKTEGRSVRESLYLAGLSYQF